MKHIGIDVRLLFQTGVGTYLQNLIHYIPLFCPPDVDFTFYCLPSDVAFIQKEVPQCRIHITTALWHSWNEQVEFLNCINADNLDLMHFTYFGHPVMYNRKYISTIHDITPLLFKTGKASTKNPLIYQSKHAAFSFILKNQVERSAAIITPTNTVKEQLTSLYGERIGRKVSPIYEGVSYRILSSEGGENTIARPYLLYVGNFYPHKNVEFLIKTFTKSNLPYVLVLAGPHDFFLKRILNSLSEEEKKYILVKDKQSLPELVALYQHAEALIHPSISEGFGLPIVEAMYFGIPIIASHIPVFQELLGASYYSFDPFEEASLQQATQTFEGMQKKKVATMRNEFSFHEMVKKTVAIYLTHVK